MIITVTMTRSDLEYLIKKEMCRQIGSETSCAKTRIKIEVKSSQNYKSEWEDAQFRAMVTVDTSIIESD